MEKILQDYKNGKIGLNVVLEKIKTLPYKNLDFAKIDTHRLLRKGFAETIFCQGKTIDQILIIIESYFNEHQNILISGATGVGKSFLACALGHRACMEGYRVRYFRLSRMFQELKIARGEGTYIKVMRNIARFNVIILDDWGLAKPVERNMGTPRLD